MSEKNRNFAPNFIILGLLYMNCSASTKYYRHFKGGKYELLAFGQDSESLAEVVVYKALYGEGKVWVRPKEMFFGTVVKDGKEVPRFQEISKTEAYGEE